MGPAGPMDASLKAMMPSTITALEWKADGRIYLASFTRGAASEFQTYDGQLGTPATGLPCKAVRTNH